MNIELVNEQQRIGYNLAMKNLKDILSRWPDVFSERHLLMKEVKEIEDAAYWRGYNAGYAKCEKLRRR